MAFISLLIYIIVIYLRPAEWIPAFYGWQLLDILAIATIFFWVFVGTGSRIKFVKVPQNIFMFGFLGALVVSHLTHFYFHGALSAFIDFSKTVIMFFLIVNLVNSTKKFKITIGLLIILTLILAVQGIMQYRTGFGLAGQPLVEGGRITWIGIFNDPNDLALAFVIVVAILLTFLFGQSAFKLKIFTLPILATLLYAIYLTNSRGGMLSLMTTVFFYFARRSQRLLFGIIVGIIFVAAIFSFGPSRLALLTAEDEAAHGRIDAWYEGMQMIKSNPIFGVGYNMFIEDYPLTAHNSFMLITAEGGLIGLFFWIALIYTSFKGLSLVQKNDTLLKSYALGLQAGLLGFLAAAFFLSRTYITLPYLLFALSVALFNVTKQKVDRLENRFDLQDIRNVGLLCIGTLGLILGIIKGVL